MSQAAPTCLLDTSIFRHGENTAPAFVNQELTWGQQRVTMPILAGMRRKGRGNDQLQSEVDKLYTIGRLAHEGRLRLYWSEEIWEELSGRRDSKNLAFPEGRPLTGCEIGRVPSPVTRARFSSEVLGAGGQTPRKKEIIANFSKRLLDLSSQSVESIIAALEASPLLQFSDFEKENLRDLQRFRQICGKTGHHLQDCFHLWTAETNKLDFFLLLDGRFRNFIGSQPIAPTVKMVIPSELLSALGVTTPDPVPSGATILPSPRPSYENDT